MRHRLLNRTPPHTWLQWADEAAESAEDQEDFLEAVSRLPVESDGLGLLYDGMEAPVWPMAMRTK